MRPSGPHVVVFVMKSCPACRLFAPRLARAAAARGLPLAALDITADRRAAALADRAGVRATPTMIVRTARGTEVRRVGAIDDAALGRLLDQAVRG